MDILSALLLPSDAQLGNFIDILLQSLVAAANINEPLQFFSLSLDQSVMQRNLVKIGVMYARILLCEA